MSTYNVRTEKDESGHWIAHVQEIPGCHTFARSLWGVHKRIREALGLWVDDAEEAELFYDVALPASVQRAVERGHRARAVADEATRQAQDVLADAVHVLEKAGLSRRDTADLLGLSHQRIQQIAREPSTGRRARRSR